MTDSTLGAKKIGLGAKLHADLVTTSQPGITFPPQRGIENHIGQRHANEEN